MHISFPLFYRPQVFEDLVGQEVNVRFLQSLSIRGLARTLIFHGPFGSSKTTSLRIYARALNCLALTPTGSPCNSCENCLRFFDGTFPDYLEVDAASNGDKDSIKNISALTESPPILGKYRVIGIDEVQQITKQGWDVLLKVIEEPPPYLVFLFSTTELDKVRPAIKSRCHCLEVNLLPPETAKKHLQKICGLEKLAYEDAALDLIVYLSQGHPRDLVKNLEHVSYFGDITAANARATFQLDQDFKVLGLFSKLLNEDPPEFHTSLKDMQIPAEAALDLFKNFFLHLQYRCFLNLDVCVNPVFKTFAVADVDSIWSKFVYLSRGNPGASVYAMLQVLQDAQVFSYIDLEIFLLNLHSFIHIFKFENSRFGGVPVSTVRDSKSTDSRVRRRQFVSIGPKQAQQEKVEPAIAVECTEVVDSSKIYPHTLLSKGFKLIKLEREQDLIFCD